MREDRTIWLVGPFPPPLHGQAVYNAAFAEHLRRYGSLRALVPGEGFASKLVGYLRIALVALVRMRRGDLVYTSMPGQAAVWLFAAVVAALRLRGVRHFVHHHSFRPIALGPMRAVRLVVALGGRGQEHILLSPAMRDRFAALYLRRSDAGRAHALSNALLFCPAEPTVEPRPPRPPTLGHLSVLSRDKGVDTLLRLFRRAAPARPDLRLVLAGPVADAVLRKEIIAAVTDFPGRVDYRGAVSGAAKQAFYADVDLFLLPSRLIDEAEPLVMLESWSAGVDFMGTDRGCIAERLQSPDRLLTGDVDVDAARLLDVIARNAADWDAARRACARRAADLHAGATDEASAVFARMFPPR